MPGFSHLTVQLLSPEATRYSLIYTTRRSSPIASIISSPLIGHQPSSSSSGDSISFPYYCFPTSIRAVFDSGINYLYFSWLIATATAIILPIPGLKLPLLLLLSHKRSSGFWLRHKLPLLHLSYFNSNSHHLPLLGPPPPVLLLLSQWRI